MAATGRLSKPHLVLDRVLVPGYRQDAPAFKRVVLIALVRNELSPI